MVRIVPFKEEHLEQFVYRGRRILGDYETELIRVYAKCGPAYTALDGNAIIGIAGVVILWPGVGEAWVYANPEIRRYPKTIHRAVKEKLDEIIAGYGLHRVQAFVLSDFETGIRWVKRLGFEEEGLMRAYTPDGKDCIRFARVEKCRQ